jgi:hypothetical protein
MVESLGREFERRGWRVMTAGIGSEPHIRGQRLGVYSSRLKSHRMLVRAAAECTASLRLAVKVLWTIFVRGNPKPDLIVLLLPSLFLCLPAAIVRWLTGARLYLVQRDIYPDWMIESGVLSRGFAARVLFALKNFALSQCDFVGVECEENYRFIPERFRDKLGVLLSWRDFGSDAPEGTPATSDGTLLVYGGRMGVVQGFDRFLTGLLSLDRRDVQLRVYCDERGRFELAAQFGDVDELQNVELREMLAEPEFLRAAAGAHFGVITLSPRMRTHNIPGKMLAYLAAGIPVLAIGPSGAALERIIDRLGIGFYASGAPETAISAALAAGASPASMCRLKEAVREARRVFAVGAAVDCILQQLAWDVPRRT